MAPYNCFFTDSGLITLPLNGFISHIRVDADYFVHTPIIIDMTDEWFYITYTCRCCLFCTPPPPIIIDLTDEWFYITYPCRC